MDRSHSAPGPLLPEPIQVSEDAQVFEFRTEAALAWVGDSSLAVADLDDGQIVLVPLFGGESRRLGRKGSGPGEFQLPISLLADGEGGLLVADSRNMRISRFDSSFRFVGSQAAPAVPLHLLRRTGTRVTGLWVMPGGGAPIISDVDLASGEVHDSWYPFDSPELARSAESLARSPFLAAAFDSAGGRLLLSGMMEYRIFDFDSQQAVRASFGRPELKPETRTAAEKEELRANMERMMRGAPVTAEMLRMIDAAADAPKPFFRSHGLSVDERGRVWVATELSLPDSTLVDVFDPSGALIGTVPLRDRVIRIAPRGDLIAALVERRSGAHAGQFGIDLYRISSR